jgi:hypothetical protein
MIPLARPKGGCQDPASMKTFRAEVRQDGELWILLVPALDNRSEKGARLIDVEQKLRKAIADRFHMEQADICLELQDRRGIARERARRQVPSGISHPSIRIS